MKISAGTDNVVVIIFNQSYYVFGTYGYCGFTIIQIDSDGTITIPNITLDTLLNNYKIGDIRNYEYHRFELTHKNSLDFP